MYNSPLQAIFLNSLKSATRLSRPVWEILPVFHLRLIPENWYSPATVMLPIFGTLVSRLIWTFLRPENCRNHPETALKQFS